MIETPSRAEQEFRNWASSLNSQDLSDHERKLLNLLLSNFSVLVGLGTAGGLRAKKLRELLYEQRETLSSAYEASLTAGVADAGSLKKIIGLEIPGPFRGFSRPEQFLFDKTCTIAYGPNGSGKSSFFEALELALLGEIEEANSKRISTEIYIVNDLSKQSSRPVVKGSDADGKEIKVFPSPPAYRFCFIEKNRIEKFGRISATTEHEQTARIAALFGLDDFNRFVNEFTERFAEVSDIDLVGRNAILLREKRETVRNFQAVLETFDDKQREFRQSEGELVTSANWESDFTDLDVALHGKQTEAGQVGGRLEELDAALLTAAEPELALLSPLELDQAFRQLVTTWQQQAETRDALQDQSQKVNFRRLHQAVLDVEAFSAKECPACSTPLSDTLKNPFARARTELDALRHIAELEGELEGRWTDFVAASRAFAEVVKDINGLLAKFGVADGFVWSAELSAPTLSFSARLEADVVAVLREWPSFGNTLTGLRDKVAEFNQRQRMVQNTRDVLQAERQKWRPISGIVKELIGRQKAALEEKRKAEEVIRNFDAEQRDLIAAADSEVALVDDNKLYVDAYNSLIAGLREYRDSLPGKLVKGVCDSAQEFYNAINENDQEFEKIAELSLPSRCGGIVAIRFKGEPEGSMHNALTVLSEGHIRCLGLAILLAKNAQENCPVLIFDDIVNAIDDDHRCTIARLLCSGDLLKDRQMILTSHGEEFTKVLESCFPATEVKSKVGRIDFLPAEGMPGIRVNYAASSRNYAVRAREHLQKNEPREALAASRRALENVCIELWRKLGISKYDALISVGLRSYTGKPELLGMLQSLKKFLRTKVTPASPENENLCGCFDFFESNWSYFNKGTHDEPFLPEFDVAVVRDVVANVETVDQLVKGKAWLS